MHIKWDDYHTQKIYIYIINADVLSVAKSTEAQIMKHQLCWTGHCVHGGHSYYSKACFEKACLKQTAER